MANTNINDFLCRYCNKSEIVFSKELLPGVEIALFKLNSNNENYSIMDYHTADKGNGGTGSQYCGFFESIGINDVDNDKFSLGRGLFFFYPDFLKVNKEIIKCSIYDNKLKYGNDSDEYEPSDKSISIKYSKNVLKIVYPADDVDYIKNDYNQPIPKWVSQKKQYLIGEVMLVGRCYIWGFYLQNNHIYMNKPTYSLNEFFINDKIYKVLLGTLKNISNDLIKSFGNVNFFKIPENLSKFNTIMMFLFLFNMSKNNNFSILATCLKNLVEIEKIEEILTMINLPMNKELSEEPDLKRAKV